MINVDNTNVFDINSVKILFNKKADPKDFFVELERKYSLNENTKFAFFCFTKNKKNPVLVSFTNEKIFIYSSTDYSVNSCYLYSDIQDIYFSYTKFKKPIVNFQLNDGLDLVFYGVDENTFVNLKDKFLELKKTIISNSKQEIYSMENERLTLNSNDSIDNILNQSTNKKKRVINDSLIAKDTTISSFLIYSLFSNSLTKLPNGQNTLFHSLVERIQYLEKSNIFSYDLDSIPLKISSSSKFNTVPVIAEFSSMTSNNELESKLLFTKNWIEYTKHNVQNKLLGVDEEGNGAYVEMKNYISTSTIDVFKAKEYKINDEIRHGLRSSQTISSFEKNQKLGIDSLYFNLNTNQKLNVTKYDGIIFQGTKHYFNVMNEFSSLQRKYCKIFHFEYKSNGDVLKSYQLVFEDDLISYKAYDSKGILVDDLYPNSSSYDLKWLTFFRD